MAGGLILIIGSVWYQLDGGPERVAEVSRIVRDETAGASSLLQRFEPEPGYRYYIQARLVLGRV